MKTSKKYTNKTKAQLIKALHDLEKINGALQDEHAVFLDQICVLGAQCIITGIPFRIADILEYVDTLDVNHVTEDQLRLRQMSGAYHREKAINKINKEKTRDVCFVSRQDREVSK